jgi:L-serine dehydratase
MNVFDIIGPIMIGPSSSHTAGAVRLGHVANRVMDGRKLKEVVITLSGSFARTYRGHGTDRALLAGIMGYHSYDAEIRDALEIAKEKGVNYRFVEEDIPNAHPNTARFHMFFENGEEAMVEGASIGGGNIRVDMVNGMRVNFNGEHNTVLILHYDRPGVIADVTNFMRLVYPDLNICNFGLSRKEKGGVALMTMELEGPAPEGLVESLRKLNNVINALMMRKI